MFVPPCCNWYACVYVIAPCYSYLMLKKNAAWAKERELKKKLEEARQQEGKMLMEGLNVRPWTC